jgi:hypothetical protein
VAGLLSLLTAAMRVDEGTIAVHAPQAIDYGEPIVYGLAARVSQGQPLYEPLDRAPYTAAIYTPVYYYVAAGLHQMIGPGFGPGRAASLVAALISSLMVLLIVAQVTRSARFGLFAGLLFLALGFYGPVPWFAVYRVDVVGVGFCLAAVLVLCSNGPSRRRVVLAGILAAIGILTKQSLAAAALTGGIWLLGVRRSSAVIFGVTVALTVGVPCLLFELSSGAFLSNTLAANVNPASWDQLAFLSTAFVSMLGPEVVLAAIYVAIGQPWHKPKSRLIVLYWLISALSLPGLAKIGAHYNYWIEFAATTVAVVAIAVHDAFSSASRSGWPGASGQCVYATVALLILVLHLTNVFPGVEEEWSAVFRADSKGTGATTEAEFAQLVDRVRVEPGGVLADPMDVVVLADRPIELEPLIFSIFELDGRWSSRPLVRRICSGQVSLLILDHSLDSTGSQFGIPDWPPSVVSSLRERFLLSGQLAGRLLYTPSPLSRCQEPLHLGHVA